MPVPCPAATALFLAAHDPPEEEDEQHQRGAGFEKQDPAVGQDDTSLRSTVPFDSSRHRWAGRLIARLFAVVLASTPLSAATADGTQPAGTAGHGTALTHLPGWHDDDLAGLAEALAGQCALRRPPAPWPGLCPALREASASPATLRAWLEQRFVAQPLTGRDGKAEGLITGYHEPVLTGSRHRESADQVALHRPPPDLVRQGSARYRLVDGKRLPYPARAAIERDQLLAGHELVWLDDPVEAFFLQIQGSGRIRLRDGGVLRVGFADHNGHPYHAIGRELVARGALPAAAVDAPAIKAWLRAHPDQAPAVMHSNPRYIFFRELATPAAAGPPGALGVPLTPLRSVATDPGFVPPGALLYLATRYPDDRRPLNHLVVSQDRGAAIVGGVRADLFLGADAEAERLAGLMKEPGRLWLLAPR